MELNITPVAGQIKPVSNLSLADMVNIGRGVQSYKSGQIALEQQDIGNLEQRAVADAIKQNPNLFMTDNSLARLELVLPRSRPSPRLPLLVCHPVRKLARFHWLSRKWRQAAKANRPAAWT